MDDMMTTPVKEKEEEDQSKVTPTKPSPCKVANEAIEATAKEAKGAKWPFSLAQVLKANAKADAKNTSKADHGGDNATEAGAKRKASNGVADSEAPKKRRAAKGRQSRARIPVPATADEATTMEVELGLEPELEPEVSGDALGATGPKLAGADSEVSGVSGVAEVPGVPVQATPMELETELPEVVSEVAGGFEVSGLATFDFDGVDSTSAGGAAAGTVDEFNPDQGQKRVAETDLAVGEKVVVEPASPPELLVPTGQEAPVTAVNAKEAQDFDGEGPGSSQATTLILGQTPPAPNAGVSGVSGIASSSKGELEPKVSHDSDDMPKKPIFAARYCTGSADAKLFWTRLQRIFNELAPEDEHLRETERAAWKYVKENNDAGFKCPEDKMKELTIQFFEMWAAKRQAWVPSELVWPSCQQGVCSCGVARSCKVLEIPEFGSFWRCEVSGVVKFLELWCWKCFFSITLLLLAKQSGVCRSAVPQCSATLYCCHPCDFHMAFTCCSWAILWSLWNVEKHTPPTCSQEFSRLIFLINVIQINKDGDTHRLKF